MQRDCNGHSRPRPLYVENENLSGDAEALVGRSSSSLGAFLCDTTVRKDDTDQTILQPTQYRALLKDLLHADRGTSEHATSAAGTTPEKQAPAQHAPIKLNPDELERVQVFGLVHHARLSSPAGCSERCTCQPRPSITVGAQGSSRPSIECDWVPIPVRRSCFVR